MDNIYYGSISIPIQYYIMAVLLGLIVGMCCYVLHKQNKLCIALLISYIFLVLSTTIFSRTPKEYYDYNLKPFWSYIEISNGDEFLLYENIANVVMMLPIGLLGTIVFRQKVIKTVGLGFLLSLCIEIMQLVLKRGLFEFDDMIHNTLGTLLGYLIIKCIHLTTIYVKSGLERRNKL